MNRTSRKLNQNSMSGAYGQSSDGPAIVSPNSIGMYRPTNVWVDASTLSLNQLVVSQTTGNLGALNVTLHYAATNTAEQNVISAFVTQWNTFAKAVNDQVKANTAVFASATSTTAEVDAIRDASWRLSGLSVIDSVEFIDDNTKESSFEVCRDLIVSLAGSSIGLHKKASLLVLADLELGIDESFTLNTLSRVLTGYAAIDDSRVVCDNLESNTYRYNTVVGFDVWLQTLQALPRRVLAARNNLAIPEDHGIDLAKVTKVTKAKKK